MLLITLVISIVMNFIPTISRATILDNVFKDGRDFLETQSVSNITNQVEGSKIIGVSKNIYNILLTIAIIVAAIVISVLGIQFVTGSIEQKAKVKEMLTPFVVGCVVIFGALGIWKLVVTIANSIF